VTIQPGAASTNTSTITAVPPAVTADGVSTSTVTVQLKDAQGNNLTNSAGTVTLSTTLGILSGVIDGLNGTYTATLTSTTTGVAVISGALNGAALAHTASVQVNPGAASTNTNDDSGLPTSITADGVSTSTVTVQLKDAQNNNLTNSAGTVTLATTIGILSGVIDGLNGTYRATLTSTTTGVAVISGALNGAALVHTATVQVNPGAASTNTSTITAVPSAVTADGVSTSTVTVQLKDAQGNNVTNSAGTVMLATTRGVLGAVTDLSNGTYRAALTSTTSGVATVSGTLNGATLVHTASVTFYAGAAAHLVIVTPPVGGGSGGLLNTQPVLAFQDAYGNLVDTNIEVTVVVTGAGGVLGGTTNITAVGGVVAYTNRTLAGTTGMLYTLTFTGGGLSTNSVGVTVQPGAASTNTTTLVAFPTSITADGVSTSTVTVQLKDANNNNLTNSTGTVILSTTIGIVSGVIDGLNGTYTATLTATTTGVATISGTLNSAALVHTATVQVNPRCSEQTVVYNAALNEYTGWCSVCAQPVVAIQDAMGNTVTTGADSTTNVVLTLTAGTGTLSGTVSMYAVAGIAAFHES